MQNLQYRVNMSGKAKERRKELSLAEKVNVINEYEQTGKSQRLLAEKFGVGKTQIQQTIKRKAEYMTAFEDNTASSRKRLCTRLSSDELEATVWSWFKTARSKTIPVSI